MKKIFSLTWIDQSKSTFNPSLLMEAQIFSSKEAAIDSLFYYVLGRIKEGAWDAEDCMVSGDFYEKEKIIDYYFNFSSDNETYASYSICEQSTTSFMEALDNSDAIEIDGNFIRHFTVASSDEIAQSDEERKDVCIFDASIVDDGFNHINYAFNYHEAMNAKYKPSINGWAVGDMDVVLINFEK